jgi:hypothetical protein
VTYAPASAPDLSRVQIRAGDYAQESFARAMSDGVLVGNAVGHYARLCRGAPALVYCVGIDHLELVAQSARTAGFRLRHVDGEMPKDERRDAVAALGAGDLDLLTNCGLFSESADVPALGAVILLRPTSICKYSASDFVATAEECPKCGAFLEPRNRSIEEADGALDEVSPLALDLRGMSYRELLTWADSDADRLRLAARVRGYKAGWVWHVQQTHRRSEP